MDGISDETKMALLELGQQQLKTDVKEVKDQVTKLDEKVEKFSGKLNSILILLLVSALGLAANAALLIASKGG